MWFLFFWTNFNIFRSKTDENKNCPSVKAQCCSLPMFTLATWRMTYEGESWHNTGNNKTGVINDPLGQPTVPAGSDCRLILKFWDGRTDRRTLCVKIVITTGRDCGRPRGSKRFPLPFLAKLIFVSYVAKKVNGEIARFFTFTFTF